MKKKELLKEWNFLNSAPLPVQYRVIISSMVSARGFAKSHGYNPRTVEAVFAGRRNNATMIQLAIEDARENILYLQRRMAELEEYLSSDHTTEE